MTTTAKTWHKIIKRHKDHRSKMMELNLKIEDGMKEYLKSIGETEDFTIPISGGKHESTGTAVPGGGPGSGSNGAALRGGCRISGRQTLWHACKVGQFSGYGSRAGNTTDP